MSDFFISYARKDSSFVRRLYDAFAAQDREVWIDWEDIPLTADWWHEIQSGIDAADAIVIVVTPNAIGSPVCNLEIAHAIQNNKRIVPIVRQEVDPEAVFKNLAARELDDNTREKLAGRDLVEIARRNWSFIARHNWLFFVDDTDFDQSFDQLNESIQTNLDYVRFHTRLLVRSVEWDSQQRNRSFLLRGDDLGDAEDWLVISENVEPQPTELQIAYIAASRQNERRIQRRLLAGVSTALVVMVILAGFALLAFSNANIERDRADDNAATSIFNAYLASTNEARAFSESTVVAEERDRADDNAATAEFNAALAATNEARAFSESTVVAEERDRADDNAATAEFNAALAATNEARAFAEATTVALARDRANEQARIALSRQLAAQSIALQQENLGLALQVGYQGLQLLDSAETRDSLLRALEANPRLVTYLRGHKDRVVAMAADVEGDLLFTGDASGSVIVWDVTQTVPRRVGPEIKVFTPIVAMHFDSVARLLKIAGADSSLTIWDINTREMVSRPREGLAANPMMILQGNVAEGPGGFSHDGHIYAVQNLLFGGVTVWDVDNGEMLASAEMDIDLAQPIERGADVAVSADGRLVAAKDGENILIWDYVNDDQTRIPVAPGVVTMQFSPDDELLAYFDWSGVTDRSIVLWDVAAKREYARLTDAVLSEALVTRLAFGPAGTMIHAGTTVGDVLTFDVRTGKLLHAPARGHLSSVDSLLAVADGRLFSGGDDTRVVRWRERMQSFLARPLTSEIDGVDDAVYGDEGARFAIQRAGTVEVRDAESGALLVQPFTPEKFNTLLYHPTRPLVATANHDSGKVELWDVAKEEATLFSVVETGNAMAIAFSPNGQWLVSTRPAEQELLLWDIDTGDMVSRREVVLGQSMLEQLNVFSFGLQVAYSPDGRYIAAPNGEDVLLWSVDGSGALSEMPEKILQAPETGGTLPWSLAFSADGHRLAVGGIDGTILVWDVERESLLLQPLTGHGDFILSLDFDPTGNLLASSDFDEMRLWDLQSGRNVGVSFDVFAGRVQYSPDGTHIATVGAGELLLWAMTDTAWGQLACQRANSYFNRDDWQRFMGETPYQFTCPEAALVEADYLALTDDREVARAAFMALVEAEVASIDHALCHYGVLDVLAEAVMPACDRAVAVSLEYGDRPDQKLESRAVGLATLGELDSAAADLREAVAWMRTNISDEAAIQQREEWITTLEAGSNPFDLPLRRRLRDDFVTSIGVTRVINDEMMPLLPEEISVDGGAISVERFAEILVEADLPFVPPVSAEMFAPLTPWFLGGASRMDRSEFGDFVNLMAPGEDVFGVRLNLPDDEDNIIAVFISNGEYESLDAWRNAVPQFAFLMLGAQSREIITVEGVDVARYDLGDSLNYFFVIDGLQCAVMRFGPEPVPGDPPLETDTVETVIAGMIRQALGG